MTCLPHHLQTRAVQQPPCKKKESWGRANDKGSAGLEGRQAISHANIKGKHVGVSAYLYYDFSSVNMEGGCVSKHDRIGFVL